MLGRFGVWVCAYAMLAGCATRASNLQPTYVGSAAYVSLSCPELASLDLQGNQRLLNLSAQINSNATHDAAAVAGAVVMAVVLPFWFVQTHGDGWQQAEYSRLLGEQQAIKEQLQIKGCSEADYVVGRTLEARSPTNAVDPRIENARRALFSPDVDVMKDAASTLVESGVRDRPMLDLVATRIALSAFTLDDNEADGIAKLCDLLGDSNDGRYQSFIVKVASGALHEDVREHADEAADELPEGVIPQFAFALQGPPSAESRGASSASSRLEQLDDLRKRGLITDGEYQAKKKEILDKL